MRLISFDVGIKNLAYCVFSVDSRAKEPSLKWSVPEWNCVNLIAAPESSSLVAHFCCHQMKGKKKSEPNKICNKPAKWLAPQGSLTYEDESSTACAVNTRPPTLAPRFGVLANASYCDLHAKKCDEYIIPKKRHSTSHLSKLKLAELEKEYDSVRPVSSGEPRQKMKKSELIERIAKYYESKCFVSVFGANDKEKTKTAGETDLVTIGRAIRRQLDRDSSVDGATHVIIENQISTLASRMKTIQGMIAQYFIMRFGDSVHIEFVSSHNKLKGFLLASSSPSQPTHSPTKQCAGDASHLSSHFVMPCALTSPDCLRGSPRSCFTEGIDQKKTPDKQNEPDAKKTTYKANKSDGIIICRGFIDANPELKSWSSDFERSKKRDDLADCFLQGIWYLKSSKKIYYADNLKINIVDVS